LPKSKFLLEKSSNSFLQKARSSLVPQTRQPCGWPAMSIVSSLHENQCAFCKKDGHWKNRCPDPRSRASKLRLRTLPKSYSEVVNSEPAASSLNLQDSFPSLNLQQSYAFQPSPHAPSLLDYFALSRTHIALLELLLRRFAPWLQAEQFSEQASVVSSPTPSSPVIAPTVVQDERPDAAEPPQPVSAELVAAQPVSSPVAAEIAIEQPVPVPAAAEIAASQPVSVPAPAEIVIAQPVSAPVAAVIASGQPVPVPAAAEIAAAQPVSVSAAAQIAVAQPVSVPAAVEIAASQPVSVPAVALMDVAQPPTADYLASFEWSKEVTAGCSSATEELFHCYSFIYEIDMSLEEMRWRGIVRKPGGIMVCERDAPDLEDDESLPPSFVWPQQAPQKLIDKPAVGPSQVPQKHQYSEAEKVEDARNLIAFSTCPDELKEKKKEEKKVAEPKGEDKAFQLWRAKSRRKNRRAKRPNAAAPASGLSSRWVEYNTSEVRDIYSRLGGHIEPVDDGD